jgi:hypothetical protein
VLYTGWTFEQVGGLTIPQMRAVLGAVNRRRKEQIEMMGGKVSEGDKEVDGTIAIEQRLQILRAKTGKTKFDLREVI